jgi:hypothetical protein
LLFFWGKKNCKFTGEKKNPKSSGGGGLDQRVVRQQGRGWQGQEGNRSPSQTSVEQATRHARLVLERKILRTLLRFYDLR